MKKTFIKILAITLSLLMAIYAIPITALEEIGISDSQDDNENGSQLPLNIDDNVTSESNEEIVYEEVALREENVKHFRLDDGSYMAAQYNYPIHTQNANGYWIDIDNTLSNSGSDFSTSNARIKFAKKTTGNETLFTLHDGHYKITMSLNGANKKVDGVVTNNSDAESDTELQKLMNLEKLSSSILYANILDGVDLEYIINSLNVKENIIIKEKQDSYSFSFTLKLNNLEAELLDSGDISVFDPDTSTVIYTIPAPIVYDAKNVYADTRDSYYTLSDNGNGKYTLTVSADSEWMNSNERAWPVVLDPAIHAASSYMIDTHVLSSSATSSYGSLSYIYVGKRSSTQEFIGYWKTTSLPTIPSNAFISSATFQLFQNNYKADDGAEFLLGLYPVTSSWSNSITWNQYSSGTNGALGELYDCVSITENDLDKYVTWDITDIVRQWINGTLSNHGVAIKQVGSDVSFSQFHSVDNGENIPIFAINYQVPRGLESYWTYASQNIADVGTGHVNLATGELTLSIDTLSTIDGLFAYMPQLVYNDSLANVYNTYNTSKNYNSPYIYPSVGYGWRLSVNESVVEKTYTDKTGTSGVKYYIWIDGDGTEHAFYIDEATGKYKDEDGLLMTMTVGASYITIEDSAHNVRHFKVCAASNYLKACAILEKITDKFGNALEFTFDNSSTNTPTYGRVTAIGVRPNGASSVIPYLTLTYNTAGCISKITSVTGHSVTFYYSSAVSGTVSNTSGGYLRQMTFERVSGSSTNKYVSLEFAYNSNHLIKVSDTISQKGIRYGTSSDKVSIVREESSIYGQYIGITYGSSTACIRASGSDDTYNNSDDILTHYTFDRQGRAVTIYSSNVDGDTVYGASSGQYSEEADNKLKTQAVSGGTGVNYLVNGGFDFGSSTLTNVKDWYTSSSRVTRSVNYNDYALSISPQANTTDYASQYVQLEAGSYTLSLDCVTENCANVSVRMKAVPVISSGETFVKDIPINQKTTNGQSAPYLTFDIENTSSYKITIEVVGGSSVSSNAKITVDNVMLERNIGSTGSNIVSISDFENHALASDGNTSLTQFNDYWDFSINNSSIIALDPNDVIRDNTLRINGDLGSSYYAYQTIAFPYENVVSDLMPARFYAVSGFGKGSHQTSSGYFGLIVTVTYSNNLTSQEYIPFNNHITELQYSSGMIAIPQYSIIKSIEVACVYANNPGTAYFDDISIVQIEGSEAVSYEYYEGTNLLKTQTTPDNTVFYEYDTNGNLIRQADFDYNYTNYTYTNNALVYEESGTFVPSAGFVLIDAIEQEEYTTTAIIKTSYIYDNYGLVTRTDAFYPGASTKVIRTLSEYDTAVGSKTFGVVLSTTDANGDTVRYSYNSSGQLLYQVNGDGVSGLYYAYDDIDRLSEVVPLTYSSSTSSYYGESGVENVEYTYNSLQQLYRINTDTTAYTFTYDEFGNIASVKAGRYTLAVYDYNDNNGKLSSMTYGNGTTVQYYYDALDRIEKISYNGTVRYEYQYTAKGQLHCVTDASSGVGYLYEYDGEGRVVGYVEYDLSDKTNTLGILYTYDERSRLFEARTTLDYSLSSGIGTYSVSEQYIYDDSDNSLTDYLIVFNTSGGSLRGDFTYDDIQRVKSKTYTLSKTSALKNTVQYTYADRNNGKLLSTQVRSYSTRINNGTAIVFNYTYDSNGNITQIVDNYNAVTKYYYDDLGQLTREDNPYTNITYVYTYDNNGNRTSKKTYAYTTGTLGTATATETYTYGDSTWGDRLTSYKGRTISYDAVGNPRTYFLNGYTYNLTWSDGRRLTRAVRGSNTYTFTYNDEGIRTSKTVNGLKHTYVLDDSRIVSEQWGNHFIVYIYDETGSPIGMQYRTSSYAQGKFDTFYFEKNLHGDILYVYDASGNVLVYYAYDAWGNCITTYYNSGASTGAQYNPFRYRGYYYDTDLGLYYLNSRYYDPNTGRFINPDNCSVICAMPNALTDKNLYAYCDNNPVTREDGDGEFWVNMVVGAVIGAAISAATQLIENPDSLQTGEFWAQVVVSAVGGAITSVVGPVCGALVSGITSGVNSSISGNDTDEILVDSVMGTLTSAISSGAQLVVGRAIAGNFIKNASKTQLKTFANSLGYVGRSYKNTSCWTGKIMFDASASNMEKPLAIATAYITSVFVDISMAMKK